MARERDQKKQHRNNHQNREPPMVIEDTAQFYAEQGMSAGDIRLLRTVLRIGGQHKWVDLKDGRPSDMDPDWLRKWDDDK